MPIRPENRHRYPKDWQERRQAVLERAGHCCEFCGARNYEPHPIPHDPARAAAAILRHFTADEVAEIRGLLE